MLQLRAFILGLVGVLSCSTPLFGGIVFDASSHATATDSSSISWSHTVGAGSSRALVVGVASANVLSLSEANSVTYNGIPMSRVTGAYQYDQLGFGAVMATDLWYLLSPPSGSANVSVSFGAAVEQVLVGAVSLDNVLQQAPEVAAGSQTSTFSVETDVTTTAPDTWLVDVALFISLNGLDPTTGQTELFEQQTTFASSAMGTRAVATPGLTTNAWLTGNPFGATGTWSHSVVGFAPVPEPSSAMLAFSGVVLLGCMIWRRGRKS